MSRNTTRHRLSDTLKQAAAVGEKEHRFTVVVRTFDSRKRAELAILSSFATRNPDGCRFYLQSSKP